MNKSATTLHLPAHLPFPVTIASFLVTPGSSVRKHDGLLVYKFYVTEEQDDDQDHPVLVRKEMVEQFDSPWEGILKEWLVKEGATVSSSRFGVSPLSRRLI